MLYIKFPIFTKFIFFHLLGEKGDAFNFSTDLEKVGVVWDVSIQNGTGVDIISEPVTIDTAKYGIITLVKIKADISLDYHSIIKEFWVPATYVHKVESHNEVRSSELPN